MTTMTMMMMMMMMMMIMMHELTSPNKDSCSVNGDRLATVATLPTVTTTATA